MQQQEDPVASYLKKYGGSVDPVSAYLTKYDPHKNGRAPAPYEGAPASSDTGDVELGGTEEAPPLRMEPVVVSEPDERSLTDQDDPTYREALARAHRHAPALHYVEPPPATPRDATRLRPDANPGMRKVTGLPGKVLDVVQELADNPVETATALPLAPVKSALTAGRYIGQKVNDATDEDATDVGEAMGMPRVSDRDAGFAAAQLAALSGGGLLNAGVTGAATKVATKLGLAGDVAETGIVGGAGRLAPTVGAAAEGSAVGAAYDTEHPGRGALVGGVLGTAADVAGRLRGANRVERTPITRADRVLPRRPSSTTAVRLVDEAPAAMHEPDYTVDGEAPLSRIEQIRQARAEVLKTRPPGESPTNANAPLSATPPEHLAVRVGPIGKDGAYFSRTAKIDPETPPYDLQGVKLANGGDPATVQQVLGETLQDPSLSPEQKVQVQQLAQAGRIDFQSNDALPIPAAAKRLGYDGIQVFEADDAKLPSSVFIWNIRKVQPGVVPKAPAPEPKPLWGSGPIDPPPALPDVERALTELQAERARTTDEDALGELTSRINMLEAQGRKLRGEPEPEMATATAARAANATGGRTVAPEKTEENVTVPGNSTDSIGLRRARNSGATAARAGDPATVNPYQPSSPLHASWTEGHQGVPAEDFGADNVLREQARDLTPEAALTIRGTAAEQERVARAAREEEAPSARSTEGETETKPARVPYSAADEGIATLYHGTSPEKALGLALGAEDKRGLFVSPDESLALGQSGKGAIIEFANPEQIAVQKHTKPGSTFVAAKGRWPEYTIAGAPHEGADTIKSVTLATGAKLPRMLLRRAEALGWTHEGLPDGRVRFRNPAMLDATPHAADKAASSLVAPEKKKYDFSSTQLDLPPETAAKIHELSAKIPDEHLAENGRETEPHITVKYGLHGNEPEKVRALLADEPPIAVTLGKTSHFPDSGSGDVVKVDVDSPQLHALNKKIADALPHTDTHPEYKPHATVAYVKKGMGKQYSGDASMEGHAVTLDRLTFSGKDGNKVEIPLGGTPAPTRNAYETAVGGWWDQQTPMQRRKFIVRGNEVYPSTPMSLALADAAYEDLPTHMHERVGIGYVQSRSTAPAASAAVAPKGKGNGALDRQLTEIGEGVADAGRHREELAASYLRDREAFERGERKASLKVEGGHPAPASDDVAASSAPAPAGSKKRARTRADGGTAGLFSPAAPGTPLGAQINATQGTPMSGPAAARAVKEVKSLAEIARTLGKLVDVPLRQGRFNAAANRARGAFFPDKEVARVLRYDHLDTVGHEIGHFISKKYLRNPTMGGAGARGAVPLSVKAKRELVKMGKDLYGTRKPTGGYGEEGIAQWARFYVMDPARLATDAPTFSAWIDAEVLAKEPALKDALDQAQRDFKDYASAPPTARLDAMIDVNPARRFLPDTRTLATAMLDDLNEIRLAVDDIGKSTSPAKNAYLLARLSRGGAGMAEEMIERGVIDPDTGTRVTKGVAEILKELKKEDVQAFRRYLVAERTLEVAKRGVNAGISVADAQIVVAQYEKQFKPLAEEVWKISNALIDYRQAKGLLTADEATNIKEKNARRVGFYRVFDEAETAGRSGSGKGFGRNSSGLQKMKGSARPIIDPLESIITDIYRTVQQSHAAEVLSALVKHADATEGAGHVIEVLTEAPKRRIELPLEQVKQQLEDLGFDASNVDPADLDGVLAGFQNVSQAGPGETKDLVRPLVIDGKRKWIQVKDAQLYNALAGLGTPVMPQWLRFLSIPTRTLRAGATLTAEFIARNPVKDAWTAAIYSRAGTRPPGWDFGKGLFHVLKADQLYQDWRLDGGDNAAMLGLDRVDIKKHVKTLMRSRGREAADWVLRPIDTLRMLSSITENATRVGEYAAARAKLTKEGMAEKDARTGATMASRDVTIDFAKAGAVGRQVNALIAFFNANVQGWDKLYREFKHHPEAVIPRLLAWITIPSLALWYLQKDDPAYQEVPAWQKMAAWVIVQHHEDGSVAHIWRIPKPPELGMLFGSAPERIADWIYRKDPRALDGLATAFQSFNPIHLPEVLAPLVEWWANKNLFTGRPIVPEGLSKLPAGEQATSRTGELMRTVGDATHLSPAKLENTVKGYTGGLGTYGLDLGDAIVRSGRSLAGASPLPHAASRGEIGPRLPLLRGFMVRVPQLDAESVQAVLDKFGTADAYRQAWRRKLEVGDREGARTYFKAHEADIRSVGTKTDGFMRPGPLRGAQEMILDAQRVSRDADDETREEIADVTIRAARAVLNGDHISRIDLLRMKRAASRIEKKGHRQILRARGDLRP